MAYKIIITHKNNIWKVVMHLQFQVLNILLNANIGIGVFGKKNAKNLMHLPKFASVLLGIL